MAIIPEIHTTLSKNAWYGDNLLTVSFPAAWQVRVIRGQPLPTLTQTDMRSALQHPIQSPPLSTLAQGKTSAVILIDDLSRPTPAADLLPLVFDELFNAGLRSEQITIISAGGTHQPDDRIQIKKKTGNTPADIRVLAHDCHNNLTDLGTTRRGTPVLVNEIVAENDLKIGIGCIYPHPAAGFSGGAKILAPGAVGCETIRILHDQFQGAQHRAGSIDTEFRQEVAEIADRIGLDFIVNVTLNLQRHIAALFAGHPVHAFEQGVAFARENYTVPYSPQSDIIIADMYPFDTDFQVAFDRGLWPIEMADRRSSKVLLASCPQGLGGHELFPVSDPLIPRLKRRLRSLKPADLFTLGNRFRAVKKVFRRKQLRVLILSQGLKQNDLKKTLPKSQILPDWDAVLDLLIQKHGENQPTTVAIYCCAPLMMPALEPIGEK